MPLCRSYPGAGLGWLFVPPGEAQKALDRKLAFRDQELATDRHASGEPAAFEAWALDHVARLASDPMVSRQIRQRRQELQRQLDSIEREIAGQVAALQGRHDAISEELLMLDHLEDAL